ncbi:MAG TPA: hydroxyisourate hydrolase, partial [Microbacterium ginsengisoli]|nr:hydroxyisourate hydrolase [Microbacterium ginsengisoli]
MSHLTTHVLDAATGAPASGVGVVLAHASGAVIAQGATDGDGRLALGPDTL